MKQYVVALLVVAVSGSLYGGDTNKYNVSKIQKTVAGAFSRTYGISRKIIKPLLQPNPSAQRPTTLALQPDDALFDQFNSNYRLPRKTTKSIIPREN